MRVYQFTEQAYYPAWNVETDSLRGNFPNKHYDPEKGSQILNRCLDEWAMCDDLGLDIMVNEHHSSATSMSVSVMTTLGILAKMTKKSRLLALGIQLANRKDPVRIAEEIAYVDTISKGRLEIGFVKGAPYEIHPNNSNPVHFWERFWESYDLVVKTLSTRDGAFKWNGKHFQHRNVNIWPTSYQRPHPRFWGTASSPESVKPFAERGFVAATFLSGYSAKIMFDGYREHRKSLGLNDLGPDHLAYNALVAVADTEEKAFRRAEIMLGYLKTSPKVAAQFTNPPGFAPPIANAYALVQRQLKGGIGAHFKVLSSDGRAFSPVTASLHELIDAGVIFAGTPDQVYSQISKFNSLAGGFGHLLMMGHTGGLSARETENNLTLMAKEVAPRLAELNDEVAA